ncbi:MAG: hypothetical protein CSA22_02950 [Deltaproteobacteria bacterium]|nr:MAG: hypothetical protein CSA22_02950 [Deltaproteobacteria bacterium]
MTCLSDTRSSETEGFTPLNVKGLQQMEASSAFQSVQETRTPAPDAFRDLYEHPHGASDTDRFVPLHNLDPSVNETAAKPAAEGAESADGAVAETEALTDLTVETPADVSSDTLAENSMPDLEAFRKQAWDTGFAEGREEGFEKGREEGYREARSVGERAADYLHGVIEAVAADRDQMLRRYEADMVELAIRIAKKVIYGQVAATPEVVRHAVAETLNLLVDPEHVILYVSPDDYEFIELIKDDFFEQIRSLKTVRITADPGIMRGGCRVERQGGEIVADIDARLEAVEMAVRNASRQAG